MMADYPLPGAPEGISTRDGLRELRETLDRLLPKPGATSQGVPVAIVPAGVTLLRNRLAVRGWVPPRRMMVGIADHEADDVMRIVGQEVEVAERLRPGQWFLTLAARKRVFASADAATLYEVSQRLHDEDDDDATRVALRLALQAAADGTDAHPDVLLKRLEQQSDDVLREIALMLAWGSAIRGLAGLAAAAGAQLKRRNRDRELEGMCGATVFGREEELLRIRRFLRAPADARQLRTLYVSGIGGSGKSTLLLAAEREIRSRGDALAVRLDFDDAYLDPLSHERMDVMFLRALSVEDPAFAPALQGIIDQLQSLAEYRMRARSDSEAETSGSTGSRRNKWIDPKRAHRATRSGSDAERASISERYERLDALGSLASLPQFRKRGVVLFLDTVENVSRRGADAIDSVLDWLPSLADSLPGRKLRVVMAGRDALGDRNMLALVKRMRDHGLAIVEGDDVALGDLDVPAARKMLEYHGIPAVDAALAAAALPRNPLVLRLAADVYAESRDEVAALQQDYLAGKIDRRTASGYLAQRVIQHVPWQPARRYAVAALALEEVTQRALRDIVIPAVDGTNASDRKLAERVYEGLSRATWLTSEDRPGTLRWHTELRNLALPMIEADPCHAEVGRSVHAAAAIWHERRRNADERAIAGEHRAKAHADPARESEDIHRMRLEGVGGDAGEGERLVAQGRPARALEMYRERPTREKGAPPTFVIRALALTGDWDYVAVDPGLVLAEVRRHHRARGGNMQRPMIERLYWLTRFELLRKPEVDSSLVDMLRDACRGMNFRPSEGALLGLVATVEALCSKGRVFEPIAPRSWPPPNANVKHELRFSMVRTVYEQFASRVKGDGWISTNLGAMFTLDERWIDDLIYLSKMKSLEVDGGARFLRNLQEQRSKRLSATLADTEQFIAFCRDVTVRLDLSRISSDMASRALRGTLIEFHSPLSMQLLSYPLRDVLASFVHKMRSSSPQAELLGKLPKIHTSWPRPEGQDLPSITATIVALDRMRLLGQFCRTLWLHRRDHQLAAHRYTLDLCARYIAWDEALAPRRPTEIETTASR